MAGPNPVSWTNDMQAAADLLNRQLLQPFRADLDDILSGKDEGAASDIAPTIEEIKGSHPIIEVSHFADTLRDHVGTVESGILGYLRALSAGVESYRDFIRFAVDAYRDHEDWSQGQLTKLDIELLAKVGIDYQPGTFVDTNPDHNQPKIVNTGVKAVEKYHQVPERKLQNTSNWDGLDVLAIIRLLYSPSGSAASSVATRLSAVAAALVNRSTAFTSRILDATDDWQGDASELFLSLGRLTAASMMQSANKILEVADFARQGAGIIQGAQMSGLTGLLVIANLTPSQYDYYTSNPSASNNPIEALRDLADEMTRKLHRDFHTDMAPYQGLMTAAALNKTNAERPGTRPGTGPGAGPGGGVPGAGPQGGKPNLPKAANPNNDPALKAAIKAAKEAQERAKREADRLKKLQEQMQKEDARRQKELQEAIKKAQEQARAAQEQARDAQQQAEAQVADVRQQARDALAKAQEQATGALGGLGTTPGTGLPTIPVPGSGSPPGSPLGSSAKAPTTGSDNPLNGRKSVPGTKTDDADLVTGLPMPDALTPALSGMGNGASAPNGNDGQVPFMPPMMGGMGAAGGGLGGSAGGPHGGQGRRGGPRLVDPGTGNGLAALSGRVRDKRREQPKAVPLDGDGWTTTGPEHAAAPAVQPQPADRPTRGTAA